MTILFLHTYSSLYTRVTNLGCDNSVNQYIESISQLFVQR
jgi:hypothetical protein